MPEFDDRSTKRIVEVVRYVEGQPRNTPPQVAGPAPLVMDTWGVTTTPITARLGNTPGTGSVQLYYYDHLSNVFTISSGSPVTVKNWTGTGLASGLWIELKYKHGALFVEGNDCSTVAVPTSTGGDTPTSPGGS